MANYYIYLAASLPMLHFGAKPPLSFEKFLLLCQDFIPEDDLALLRDSNISGDYPYSCRQPSLEKWFYFDRKLRNELVKVRSARKRLDPHKYLRQDTEIEPQAAQLALQAQRMPSLIEAEKTLDAQRWYFLEELSSGHYFDLDFLVVYALKLLILLRWEKIFQADKEKLLAEALARG